MDLNDYFKTLAEEHVDILHTDEHKGYFRSYSSSFVLLDNEFNKNLRVLENNVLISQFNQDAQLPTPMDDFARQNPNGTLYILSRIKDVNYENARLKAIELREDIIARLKYEMRNGALAKQFQITAINSQTIGRVADNFYGIALFIAYEEKYESNYDVDKWQQSIS